MTLIIGCLYRLMNRAPPLLKRCTRAVRACSAQRGVQRAARRAARSVSRNAFPSVGRRSARHDCGRRKLVAHWQAARLESFRPDGGGHRVRCAPRCGPAARVFKRDEARPAVLLRGPWKRCAPRSLFRTMTDSSAKARGQRCRRDSLCPLTHARPLAPEHDRRRRSSSRPACASAPGWSTALCVPAAGKRGLAR